MTLADAGPEAVARPIDRSLEHLLARLLSIEERVRQAVLLRRASDPEPDDPLRGLYLSEAAVDLLLEREGTSGNAVFQARLDVVEREADGWEAAGERLRLRSLARAFNLDGGDLDMLLAALAPDLDRRFESFYGYLQDDVTRRRATVGLAMELAGLTAFSTADRARLAPTGPLAGSGLIELEESERPFLTRGLRVPDRVTAFLLGDDAPDARLAAILIDRRSLPSIGASDTLLRALREGLSPVFVRESVASSGLAVAVASATAAGLTPLPIDLARLARAGRPSDLAGAAVREARLAGGVVIGGPVEALVDQAPELTGFLAEANCPVVLAGERAWDPRWSSAVPLLLEATEAPSVERRRFWQALLGAGGGSENGHSNGHTATGHAVDDPDGSLEELLRATRAFRLSPPQALRAVQAAQTRARAEDRPLEPADLQAGARAQNAAGLGRLARRVEPVAGWDDLVLPADIGVQLRELASRARQRERVLDDWGIGRATRGRGITALFAGESGTGKSLAAEVIAAELGLDLYVIDLSTVVDKYIGETEKNLDRIFAEADRVNGVLLFDEADAIFGKRSEVRDARDRYANLEVAYLLQRMERFDGLAILTTNLRANLDEAFTRRIDVIVDFPIPEEGGRLAIWRMHLPASLPQEPDLDLEFMARRFRMSGGNVRNICLTAAFLAAEAERPIEMLDLIRATEREYRKLGRLTVEAEFGDYHAQLTGMFSGGGGDA